MKTKFLGLPLALALMAGSAFAQTMAKPPGKPGSAAYNQWLGQSLATLKGNVLITGHTDNQPIRTREFPDNQVLSEKRAVAVSSMSPPQNAAGI